MGGCANATAAEHLVEVHLITRRAVLLVLWSPAVSITMLSSTPASSLHLVQQLFQLAGLDEFSDVVVGVEAFFGWR